MRNINNELPANLIVGKDIDILVKKNDRNQFISFFQSNNYKLINHPMKNEIFLYGVNKFDFQFNKTNQIIFDLSFQIAVKSLDAGQLIPLDQLIQVSAWKNKRFKKLSSDFGYWALSYEDEFVCLLSRSIFDKKEFQTNYIERINELYIKINKDDVVEKLNLIFFKYTPHLLQLIKDKKYSNIIENYFKFKEY